MTGADFDNTKINTWIHIQGLPYELRRLDIAKSFASLAGQVKQSKQDEGHRKATYEGEYMRIRIELDTHKPILSGLFLRRLGRKPTWVSMKYERLPNVCFKCGKLTNETRACREARAVNNRQFGGWLKAKDRTKYTPEWTTSDEDSSHLVVELVAKKAPGGGNDVSEGGKSQSGARQLTIHDPRKNVANHEGETHEDTIFNPSNCTRNEGAEDVQPPLVLARDLKQKEVVGAHSMNVTDSIIGPSNHGLMSSNLNKAQQKIERVVGCLDGGGRGSFLSPVKMPGDPDHVTTIKQSGLLTEVEKTKSGGKGVKRKRKAVAIE